MRFIKRVTDRGSVTLPSDVREALGVQEGDIVEFEIVAIVKRSKGPPLAGRPVARPEPQRTEETRTAGADRPDANPS